MTHPLNQSAGTQAGSQPHGTATLLTGMQMCSTHQGTDMSMCTIACELEGDPPPASRSHRSTQVCVCQTYIQTHALSHTGATQGTAQPTCPQEHSFSTRTSTSLAQTRDPGFPGHTKQTQRQWNGTFNCLYGAPPELRTAGPLAKPWLMETKVPISQCQAG